MHIFSYTHEGYDGYVITVEVDVRNGIPNTLIVGLAGHAIQEAKERVRVSLKNSGFVYPDSRVVINLSPASLPKRGTAFDLAIAYSLLVHTKQIKMMEEDVMLLGELHLDGSVAAVSGIISAIDEGLRNGVRLFVVPHQNYREAELLEKGKIIAVSHLRDLHDINYHAAHSDRKRFSVQQPNAAPNSTSPLPYEIAHIIGHRRVKRIMEIAVAGHHHCLFVGPPGSGKTLSAQAMNTLNTSLTPSESVEVTRISSLANQLSTDVALITRPPFRAPHHSISYVGMLGGGDPLRPGEIALAHNGILLLDEVLEFKRDVLQGLRQPLEEREIRIVRAQRSARFPSDFLLVMTANICPCGNFGKRAGACFCKIDEIKRYWKRLGGAFLDRISLRCLLTTDEHAISVTRKESAAVTTDIIRNIETAIAIQRRRYRGEVVRRNGHLRANLIEQYCALSTKQINALHQYVLSRSLSYRAIHAIQTVARTIADLDEAEQISDDHLQESIDLRSLMLDVDSSYSADIIASFLG